MNVSEKYSGLFRKLKTYILPPPKSIDLQSVFDITRIHQTGLAEMMMSELGADDTLPEEGVANSSCCDILRCTERHNIPTLLLALREMRKKPLSLRRLLPLATRPKFRSFDPIFAFGSVKRVESGNRTMYSTPCLFLTQRLSAVLTNEERIHEEDEEKRRKALENLRHGRGIGCDFLNEHTTKGILIAVESETV